jgi:23S rRNA (cytidine1920-2'-O)/16S rRNA (cytidine1409-2'-O)-methyltransferase
VRRGIAQSSEEAASLIESGSLRVGGILVPKATTMVEAATPIELVGPPPKYVSRGGLKLEEGLEVFGIDVTGRRCIDLGASTGGFTDCLLQRGAAEVVAVDVGYGQLDSRIAGRDEVTVIDRTNIRLVDPDDLGAPFSLVVGDLSFISLCAVAGQLRRLVASDGELVLLVKPQFEVPKGSVGKGGVVRSEAERETAIRSVRGCLESAGLVTVAVCLSPITGAKGNVEYLLHARPGSGTDELAEKDSE